MHEVEGFRPFESDEISEFSTLGAKGKIAFGLRFLVKLPAEFGSAEQCGFAWQTTSRRFRRYRLASATR